MNEERTIAYRIMSAGRSGRGLSFFQYAENLSPETSIGKRPSPPTPLHHIFSLMRALECDVLVEEELDPSSVSGCEQEVEILQEKVNSDIKPLCRRAFRLTFFRMDAAEVEGVPFQTDPDKARDTNEEDRRAFHELKESLECLGFLYLYVDSSKDINLSAYVPQAVVKPLPSDERRGPFIHSRAEFLAKALGATFLVEGSFFAQQEGSTWCCAHAAVMTSIMNIHGAIGRTSGSFCVQSWNALLGIDHVYRNANGLSPDEIKRILDKEGIQSFCADYETVPPTYTYKGSKAHADGVIATAYYAIEAGLSAIIGFAGEDGGHAMAVVGHTFDPSMWSPTATRAYFHVQNKPYIPSHAWVDNLVIQDDNLGPYCTLPRTLLQERNPRVITPKFPGSKVDNPDSVEADAAHWLAGETYQEGRFFQTILQSESRPSRDENRWFFRLMKNVSMQSHVLRTVPIVLDEYFDFLEGKNDLEEHILGEEFDTLTGLLRSRQAETYALDTNEDGVTILRKLERCEEAPFSWLVEISIPELYQWNNRRLGEVILKESTILKATPAGPVELPILCLLLVRVPGVLSVPNPVVTEDRYLTYAFDHHPIPGKNHYPIVAKTIDNFRRSWLGKPTGVPR